MTPGEREPSKQERTYAVLRERILDGSYGPGYRLVIDAIARELEVSPMPVREAIRRLEAEGWVIYRANQGAQVAPVDTSSWKEVMVTLALLEGYATAAASSEMRVADLRKLRSINKKMRGSIDRLDLMQVSRFNNEFHEVIYDRCPNDYLRRELRETIERLNTLRATVFVYIPTRGNESAAEHDRIADLIEERADRDRIEREARAHKLRTVEAYEVRLAEADRLGSRSGGKGPA
ncbi:MAG: GntR family transcriptional regulator [Solirubrobacterales bacterium]